MKKLTLSQMKMKSRKFMSYSSPIQSEKENSSNSRVKKANTGVRIRINNTFDITSNKQCFCKIRVNNRSNFIIVIPCPFFSVSI